MEVNDNQREIMDYCNGNYKRKMEDLKGEIVEVCGVVSGVYENCCEYQGGSLTVQEEIEGTLEYFLKYKCEKLS